MSQAETAAKVASLRHLGYSVPATPVGAVIAGTFPGTPAYGVLNVGDVITAVDGVPTTSAQALTSALAPYKPGQAVTFTVRRNGTAPPGPVTLTLRQTIIEVDGERVRITVGIEPQDQVRYTYPFPVSIDVVDIGGPLGGTGHDPRRHRHPQRRSAHRWPQSGGHRHDGRLGRCG